MLKNETLLELQTVLGFDEMVRVIGIQAILHTTKPELSPAGIPIIEAKCERKFARLLGETPESAKTSLKALLACHSFEQRQAMHGVGGCVARPLRYCLIQGGAMEGDLDTDAAESSPRPRP